MSTKLRKLILIVAALFVSGCASIQNPGQLLRSALTVPKSYAVAAPAQADSLAIALFQCVGRLPQNQIANVKWRQVDAVQFTMLGDAGLAGWSNIVHQEITLATPYKDRPDLIQHELVHTLYGIIGHPADPFEKCDLNRPIPRASAPELHGWSLKFR